MQLQHKFLNIKFSKNVSKKKKLIDSNTSLLDLHSQNDYFTNYFRVVQEICY